MEILFVLDSYNKTCFMWFNIQQIRKHLSHIGELRSN